MYTVTLKQAWEVEVLHAEERITFSYFKKVAI